MWKYQQIFRLAAQNAARNVLHYLDARLDPVVFLLGLPTSGDPGEGTVQLEPQNLPYADVLVEGTGDALRTLLAQERDLPPMLPWFQTAQTRSALQRALVRLLADADPAAGLKFFCSEAALVGGYLVCVVLGVQGDSYQAHYALTGQHHSGPTSLLDATVSEFLAGCTTALNGQEPGADLDVLSRDYKEVVRAAGRMLMSTPAAAVGGTEQAGSLYEIFNTISSLRYEGAESLGSMLLARRAHPHVESLVTFRVPIPLESYRAARKMLELATDTVYLLSDALHIYGLGMRRGAYEGEDIFQIRFKKHHTWELHHGPHVLMRATYGQAQLPRPQIREATFKTGLTRIFGPLPADDVERIWQITVAACQQKHGTLLVILEGAEEEAARLAGQSTAIEPIILEAQHVPLFTAIDGALLVDPQGRCHALGVILDGFASHKGSPARGARYNSAVRYIEAVAARYAALAVIISADGTIDLVPHLKPQICRAAIEEVLEQLRVLRTRPTIDEAPYEAAIKWLDAHRFYLLPDVCQEVNMLKREIGVRLFRQDPTMLRLNCPDFVPDAEMNEGYFLDNQHRASSHQ